MGVDNPELDTPTSSIDNLDALPSGAETGAESSAAPEGEKFDLLSVVRNAVQTSEEGDSASPAGQDESDQPSAEGADSNADDPKADSEDYSDVPFHTHPRFKQLVSQVKQYKADAQQFHQVTSFLQAQGMTPEEAADALILRAEMKHNPQEAWKKLKPMVQQLLIEAGEVLPADLMQQVREGKLTKENAVEISRLRANQGIQQKMSERQRQEAEQRQQVEHIRSIQTAVAQWEMGVKQRDPDYAKKEEELQKEILWLQKREGVPKDVAGVRKQLQQAYDTVSKRLAPAPRPARTSVPPGRVASGQPTAAPKSMLDVVRGSRSQG